MPLLEHLIELRRRLSASIAAFMIMFCICYYFSGDIYYFLAEPLAHVLEGQGMPTPHLIYTSSTKCSSPRSRSRCSARRSVAFPIIASQLWLFVAPGLYRSEKRALAPVPGREPVLFLMGGALAYYVVFPFAWKFFASFQIQHRRRRRADRAVAGGLRVSRPGDEAHLRLRADVPVAGAADPACEGRDRLVEGAEAVPPLRLCGHVRGRSDPRPARRVHPDQPRAATDPAVQNLRADRADREPKPVEI